ncbi:Uu.00g092570.m01.CDS01 [Anthostomella pinea]|uniref:Uu.00g092570.m01.CDS01 n=1 Tax=Anthostomella pinea TaxID=933095 RepID=A0AAI8YKC9_9PEZI|nr:Uu.00g092570.m01.CDS01 [Anthostomella pinea]
MAQPTSLPRDAMNSVDRIVKHELRHLANKQVAATLKALLAGQDRATPPLQLAKKRKLSDGDSGDPNINQPRPVLVGTPTTGIHGCSGHEPLTALRGLMADQSGDRPGGEAGQIRGRGHEVMASTSLASPGAAAAAARPFHRRVDRLRVVNRTGRDTARATGSASSITSRPFNLIARISEIILLADEVAKYLEPADILNLYSVSRHFHVAINGNLTSSLKKWADARAPGSASIFPPNVDQRLCIPDPGRRVVSEFVAGGPNYVRRVPTLRWYQMVVSRHEMAEDIIAHLARAGLRTPRGTHITLLRIWFLMNVATTEKRLKLVGRKDLWSNADLVNAQVFFLKLSLHFNDPNYGPDSSELFKLFMGQRGLHPLWQMLFGHRYRTTYDLLELKVRYDVVLPAQHRSSEPVCGVARWLVGSLHLEGWGSGVRHLARPEEVVISEWARRGLRLDLYLLPLTLWGHVDHYTGRNLAPQQEELDMLRDAEYKNRSLDTTWEFKNVNCMKDRWNVLTREERTRVLRWQDLAEEHITKADNATPADYGHEEYYDSDDSDGGLMPSGPPNVDPRHDFGPDAPASLRQYTDTWEATIKAIIPRICEASVTDGDDDSDDVDDFGDDDEDAAQRRHETAGNEDVVIKIERDEAADMENAGNENAVMENTGNEVARNENAVKSSFVDTPAVRPSLSTDGFDHSEHAGDDDDDDDADDDDDDPLGPPQPQPDYYRFPRRLGSYPTQAAFDGLAQLSLSQDDSDEQDELRDTWDTDGQFCSEGVAVCPWQTLTELAILTL